MQESAWRPPERDLLEAKQFLHTVQSRWAKTRLSVINKLLENPKMSDQAIAQTAETRTVTLKRLLETWRNQGMRAVLRGRSRSLDPALLAKLKSELSSDKSHSLESVQIWLRGESGQVYSIPTVRRYCRELGFELPLKKGASLRNRGRTYKWTEAQITELQACSSVLGPRAAALLKIGTEKKSPLSAAQECGVKPHRVRRDLRYFLLGKLRTAIAHTRTMYILDEKGVRESFWEWCDWEFACCGGKCPSGKSARKFLKTEHHILMSPRAIYRHLRKWRKNRHIDPRTYKKSEKRLKSEGLVTRVPISQRNARRERLN